MNSGSGVDDEGSTESRGVVVAANIDAVDFNDLVGWNVVVGDRGVGVIPVLVEADSRRGDSRIG